MEATPIHAGQRAGSVRPLDTLWPLGFLTLILAIGAALRLHGLNWDETQLFHPDERWIIVVASELRLPERPAELVPPDSPLNPFWDQAAGEPRDFAYGHFPLYLLRLTAWAVTPFLPPQTFQYEHLVLVARLLSVVADLATITLTYALGRRLYGTGVGLVAAGGVSLATLHVQLAHYYTSDPILTALVMASVLALTFVAERGSTRASVAAGIGTGLAIGTKTSAIVLLIPVVIAHMIDGFGPEQRRRLRQLRHGPARRRALVDLWDGLDRQRGWQGLLPALCAMIAAFVVTNPYAVADSRQFLQSVAEQSGLVQGRWILPYTEQYRGTLPYLYFVVQQLRWFLGPLLGLLAWSGFLWMLWRAARLRIQAREWPALLWALPYFAVTGGFFAKFPRYLQPLTPLLFLWGAALLYAATARRPRWRAATLAVVFSGATLYALAFSSIYTQRHPWIQASEWLYRHAAPGDTILVELWDHPLPVSMDVDGAWRRGREFTQIMVDPYDLDGPAKEAELLRALTEADWVVLSSPRGWGVLRRLGGEYPAMPAYYEALLTGRAGYEIAGIWRVEPRLGPVSLGHNPFVSAGLPTPPAWGTAAPTVAALDLGFADESFYVYDHPMPIILRKTETLTAEMLAARLWPDASGVNPEVKRQGEAQE